MTEKQELDIPGPQERMQECVDQILAKVDAAPAAG